MEWKSDLWSGWKLKVRIFILSSCSQEYNKRLRCYRVFERYSGCYKWRTHEKYLNWSWHQQLQQLSSVCVEVQLDRAPPPDSEVLNVWTTCQKAGQFLNTCIGSPESWLWLSTSSVWSSTICPGAAGTVSSSDMSRSPSRAWWKQADKGQEFIAAGCIFQKPGRFLLK